MEKALSNICGERQICEEKHKVLDLFGMMDLLLYDVGHLIIYI